jgi:nucleoside 2-deoxyribosyltransferase
VSEKNPIRVFVTHNFQESDDYLRVFEFLESMERFFYLNCSKPENMPGTGGLDAIKEELIAQIKECEAVIVLATQYMDHDDLTKFQMDVAGANEKPMIAIRPFGGVAETPQELVDRVSEHIEWNERDMVDALKRQARLEDTSRWETIEFTLD